MGQFTKEAQLHGAIIVKIKAQWPCAAHPGEAGGDGYCYIGPSGEHIGLHNRRLKLWAAVIAGMLMPTTHLYNTNLTTK